MMSLEDNIDIWQRFNNTGAQTTFGIPVTVRMQAPEILEMLRNAARASILGMVI